MRNAAHTQENLATVETADFVSRPATSRRPQSSEMSGGPGFRIRSQFSRPPRHLCAAFADYEVADISDMMNRLYTTDCGIRNVANNARIVGPALCVKVFPGDNLMVHKALDLAQRGDILVVDTGSSTHNAVLGDLVANKARHRGFAGVIIDGLVRDIEGIVESGLPVFARGVTAFGPLHRGPGEVNYPISCGGVVVHPGDIIAADAGGVVIIPQAHATDVLARLDARREALAEYTANVKKGVFSNAWVDAQLEEANCPIE
jgi:RraA family protein